MARRRTPKFGPLVLFTFTVQSSPVGPAHGGGSSVGPGREEVR